jgi:hypothetical protein
VLNAYTDDGDAVMVMLSVRDHPPTVLVKTRGDWPRKYGPIPNTSDVGLTIIRGF